MNVNKLLNALRLALYGAPLRARIPGPVMPCASNPERYDVSPEHINDDVFTAVRMSWVILTKQWDMDTNGAAIRAATTNAKVSLPACLMCDWNGHVTP